MTPLAQSLIKRELLPPHDRREFKDYGRVIPDLMSCHCFEVTAIVPLFDVFIAQLKRCGNTSFISRELLFLPAPKTWLEVKGQDGGRTAYLLKEADDLAIEVVYVSERNSGPLGKITPTGPLVYQQLRYGTHLFDLTKDEVGRTLGLLCLNMAALVMINTPRIFGRRQHMPHRGLEKRLLKERPNIGKFPLQAWTEIKLEVTPPKEAAEDGIHEAHLTGHRALHFCRAHLRIWNGQLVYVRSHWRGDSSLGIKQSRYTVVPPKEKVRDKPNSGCGVESRHAD